MTIYCVACNYPNYTDSDGIHRCLICRQKIQWIKCKCNYEDFYINDAGEEVCWSCEEGPCKCYSEILELDYGIMAPVFISEELFERLAATRRTIKDAKETEETDDTDRVIDWCELRVNVIYKLNSLLPVPTKYDYKTILVLIDKEGVELRVWSPPNVSTELKIRLEFICSNTNLYIKSLGEKIEKTSSGIDKRYFDFETVNV